MENTQLRGTERKSDRYNLLLFYQVQKLPSGDEFLFHTSFAQRGALVWRLSLLVSASGTEQMFARRFVSPCRFITRSAATAGLLFARVKIPAEPFP